MSVHMVLDSLCIHIHFHLTLKIFYFTYIFRQWQLKTKSDTYGYDNIAMYFLNFYLSVHSQYISYKELIM